MESNFNYYFNHNNSYAKWRNNLIYTSLISDDQKTFCQWYYNDLKYHLNQNQVVDADKMEEKWNREVKYLTTVAHSYPDIVPAILDIDIKNKKIYLSIDGPDFWQRSVGDKYSFDEVLPDWQEQMLDIVTAHRSLGLWKYSMHPSSYFVVDGRLKSINYFFTYSDNEQLISIKDVESHIYSARQDELKKYISSLNIDWNTPQEFVTLNQLCWESFRTNFPSEFIEKAKCIK
jgi:hypothetical protein